MHLLSYFIQSTYIENTGLLDLDISHNKLKDLGLDRMLGFIHESTSKLEILNLQENKITSIGISKLFEAMQSNKGI